jgi:hypothetical protein
MLQAARFNFRDRSVAICAAFGLASAMAFGGAAIAPTVASANATSPNAPVSTLQPHLAGSAAQGSVITSTPGTFSNETTQHGTWFQCPSAGSNKCTATKNTGSTYTLTGSDPVGDYIRLDEVAANASGTNTVWSNVIGPITASAGSAGSGSGSSGSSSSGYTGACTQTISPGTNPATVESSMSAGQVLCLNSGTYQSITQSSANVFAGSGSAGSPIVVTSAPGQTATIQGADFINGNYVTLEYMNLDQADTLYDGNGGSNPAPCSYPLSEGMQINGSYVTLQNDNVYESKYRGVLIGIDYADPSNPSTGDIIRDNNIGPGGGCSQTQHLIYDDHSSNLQIYNNWMFDDHFGYAVQLYTSPGQTSVHGNVFDDVLNGVVDDSDVGANQTDNNVEINGYGGGPFLDNFRDRTGVTDTVNNNAVYNVSGGIGSAEQDVTLTGNITLTANPFVGGKDSDNYTPASNSAAASVASYGLWNGQGPPSPNPAVSYPVDP